MASTPAEGSSSIPINTTAVAKATVAVSTTTTSIGLKSLDESFWWDSFVLLLEELENAISFSEPGNIMVNKLKINHAWFLGSITLFKPPNEASRRALDSNEISMGLHNIVIEPRLKEAAFRASKFLNLDEVQTYILVSRSIEHKGSISCVEEEKFVHWVLLHYFFERQCLLKCTRRIFVNSLSANNRDHSSNAFKEEAMQLIHERLDIKLLSVLRDLLSYAPSEKFLQDVELVAVLVDETIIEDILILDILFLAYYDNFCVCNAEQWMCLCTLFKGMLEGSYDMEKLAVSVDARASFTHAKVQLLLILIETLDLENLLRMVHDEVPFSEGGSIFSVEDIQKMDYLISNLSALGAIESGPLFLAWAVFVSLISSLPDIRNHHNLMEIDHVEYARQAFEVGTFSYLVDVLRSDSFKNSDGPISGFLNILRTLMSAFIASYELSHQPEKTLSMILEILCEIYQGEESLSIQFWDRDSFVDGPVRSLLYMLESEYPYHVNELLRLLSALCNGSWSAECVYNFLDKMNGMTLLFEGPSGYPPMNVYDIVEAHQKISVPGAEGISISPGCRGQILKVIGFNVALARWECAHSGIYLLVLRLALVSHSVGGDEVTIILNLLHRLLSFNEAVGFNLLHLDKSLFSQAAQKNGLIEPNMCIDVVKIISSLAVLFLENAGPASIIGLCLNILAEMLRCAPSQVIDTVFSSNVFGTASVTSSSDAWLLSGGLSQLLFANYMEESGCSLLTLAALNLTNQLIEKGTGDALVCALVVFSLQYVFVNHMHVYKVKNGHWKVTLKVLDVMRSCVKRIQGSHKFASMIRDILYFDSSIHNCLRQLLHVSEQALKKSSLSYYYSLKETEDLQNAACIALEIVYFLLDDLLKGSFFTPPPFVQILLPWSSKSVSVFTVTSSLMSLFSNPEVQVVSTKVLSILCALASRLQPYSLENITLLDAVQINELTATICLNLDEESCRRKNLLISTLDLLVSAAYFQPSLLVPIISSHVEEEGSRETGEKVINKLLKVPLVYPICSRRCIIDAILKFVNASERLIKSDPRLLMSTLKFLKSLWDGGAPYMELLKKVRKSVGFWECLSSILSNRINHDNTLKNLSDDDILHVAYQYRCQGIVLEIMSRELYLLDKVYQNEMHEKQASKHSLKGHDESLLSIDVSQSLIKLLKNILSNWHDGSTIDTIMKSYSSGGYDLQIVSHAKIAACLLIVHLMLELSSGSAECLSMSLIGRIRSMQDKLIQNSSFCALVEQYSFRGYSEGKDVNSLVLHDLYYHLKGELEGRLIAPGLFQDLTDFLINSETFQCRESKNEDDFWNTNLMMYDIPSIRAELGMDLWDNSEWKTTKEIGEKMLSRMQAANLMISLADAKYFALRALVFIISLYHEKVSKAKSIQSSQEISDAFVEWSIKHFCKCTQSVADSIAPLLNPSEKLLELLAVHGEMLLVLSKILFSEYSHRTNKQEFSVSIFLIKTYGACFNCLANGRPSSCLTKAVKILLIALLITLKNIIPTESINDENQFTEASSAVSGLLPVLCKYVEHVECFDLSVSLMDLMLKCFLTPDIWLPVLKENLPLKHLIQTICRRSSIVSVGITLNFLLTLVKTKGGAEMLHSVNLFPSLKILFGQLVDENVNDKCSRLVGLSFAIISSVLHSLQDDSSVNDVLESAVHSFLINKPNAISSCLSVPSFPSDVGIKKVTRNQDPLTSLASLRLSEQALSLICLLAGRREYRRKGMKELDVELRQRSIHFLAFISKEAQHTGSLSSKGSTSVFCVPTLREELECNYKPSFVGSKHGWFSVSARVASSRSKANGQDGVKQPTYFSDLVAVQIYRVAFLLLTFLCIQAKFATERAAELGYIDLIRFPDLPMPEILHSLQDQAIAVVVDVCSAKPSDLPAETQSACLLMLQILEKSLYLEFCVTQSCGIRPVLGRVEDISTRIKSLMEVVKQRKHLRVSLASLTQIIALVYPGIIQANSIL